MLSTEQTRSRNRELGTILENCLTLVSPAANSPNNTITCAILYHFNHRVTIVEILSNVWLKKGEVGESFKLIWPFWADKKRKSAEFIVSILTSHTFPKRVQVVLGLAKVNNVCSLDTAFNTVSFDTLCKM